MGAPQFLHLPRSHSHVTSGTLRYHGMACLQCGQWDGGETMLMPNGIRWMHTLRKLPTQQPNAKNTSDQNSKGTRAQISGSKIGFSIGFQVTRDRWQVTGIL